MIRNPKLKTIRSRKKVQHSVDKITPFEEFVADRVKKEFPDIYAKIKKEAEQEFSITSLMLSLRLDLGLSQKAFAEKLDMKQSQLSRYERGGWERAAFGDIQSIVARLGKKLEVKIK